MCALALAKAGIHVRIVDSLPERILTGRADGIHMRTLEILQACTADLSLGFSSSSIMQSYGLAQRIISLGHRLYVSTSYGSGSDGRLVCTGKKSNAVLTGGRFPFGLMVNQGAIEGILRNRMRSFGTAEPFEYGESMYEHKPSQVPRNVQVEQGVAPIWMGFDSPGPPHFVQVRLQGRDGTLENVKAKYVVGCDGAHSWVRSQLGFRMEGDQSSKLFDIELRPGN
jgi:phenol 2-monooxygenase